MDTLHCAYALRFDYGRLRKTRSNVLVWDIVWVNVDAENALQNYQGAQL